MNLIPYPDDSERQSKDLVDETDKFIDVPYFSLESILAATNNFSDTNKLGRGGFGPVYKVTIHLVRVITPISTSLCSIKH